MYKEILFLIICMTGKIIKKGTSTYDDDWPQYPSLVETNGEKIVAEKNN